MSGKIQATEAKTKLWRLSLFVPSGKITPGTLVSQLSGKCHALLDGETLSFPPSPTEFDDMVLAIRSNSKKTLVVEFAINRLNVIVRPESLIEAVSPSDLETAINEIAANLAEKVSPIVRVAYWAEHVLRVEGPPGSAIAKRFLDEFWLKDNGRAPEHFELHWHRRATLSGLDVNSWIRFKSAILTPEYGGGLAIHAIQDVNSLSPTQDSKVITPSDCRSFFSASDAFAQSELREYVEDTRSKMD